MMMVVVWVDDYTLALPFHANTISCYGMGMGIMVWVWSGKYARLCSIDLFFRGRFLVSLLFLWE